MQEVHSDINAIKPRKQTKKEKLLAADLLAIKIICPVLNCDKELKDIRGSLMYFIIYLRLGEQLLSF